jgi:hypothetical protein
MIGGSGEVNLCLACRLCNGYRSDQTVGSDPKTGDKVALFNPRRQRWADHFRCSEDGVYVLGRTACGRAMVDEVQIIPML